MKYQIGQTLPSHQSNYTFQQDEQRMFQIFLTNKNTITFIKNGIIHQSLSIASHMDEVEYLSICTSTGNIILVSESNEIFMINYVSIIEKWILLETSVSLPLIKTQITAIEYLNKREILICDMLNVSVYKIQQNVKEETPNLVRTWVKENPTSPVFNFIKHCNNTSCNTEHVCSKFNLLTYNDSLVYVWKRTVIDVDEDIYSYQLNLINTDKLNSSIVTYNKWSKIDDIEILYTLNEDSVLRIWKDRSKEVELSLEEMGHQFITMIKISKSKDIIVTFGFDNENSMVYSIYEVTYDYNNQKIVVDITKENEVGSFFSKQWTKEDYIEFSVDQKNCLLFANNFDKLSTAAIKFDLDSYDFKLISLASGNSSKQKVISSKGRSDTFYTHSFNNSNEVTKWQMENDILYSTPCSVKCGDEVKQIEQLLSGELVYLLDNKLILGERQISFEQDTCTDMCVLNNTHLVLTFKDRAAVYSVKTLEIIKTFDIDNNTQSFIHHDSIITVKHEKSKIFAVKHILKSNIFQSFDVTTTEKSFSFDLEPNFQIGECKNGIIALKDEEQEILFYDIEQMFMLEIFKNADNLSWDNWLLDTNGRMWLVVYNDDCITLYNDEETKNYKTMSKCKEFFTMQTKIILVFENYFEVIKMEDLFETSHQDEESLIKATMDIGDYSKVAKFFKYLETNIKNDLEFNTKAFEETVASIEDLFNNKEIWKETFFYLNVKLQKEPCLMTVLNFINELINNRYPKVEFFGLNYHYKAQSNNVEFKDSVVAGFEKDFIGPEDVDFFKGFKAIFHSAENIKADFDILCKSIYQETKNPHDVGLYYLAMGKLSEYKLIWKYSTKKESDKINNFLGNYNNKKCLNNGYKLLSLHRYSEACWFFLLGEDYKSCFYTILKKMHDFNLAVGVIKVFDPTGEKLKECLKTYCIEYFEDLNKFWHYFYSGLIINNYNMEFVDLDNFVINMNDLESLLMMVKSYGTDTLEKDILRRIQRLADLSGKEKLLSQYTPQEKRPFIVEEQKAVVETETNLFKSFNSKPKAPEVLQVTSAEPMSMLDDWM